jgi:hypothetical protein
LFALLPDEDGLDGKCTVAGLGSSIRAGFTKLDTTNQKVKVEIVGNSGYAVLQISGANPGTIWEINRKVSPDIYIDSSCPLQLDSSSPAESGKEYTITGDSPPKTQFLKKGNYLIYLVFTDLTNLDQLRSKVSGTALSPNGGVPGVGDLDFVKSCQTGTDTCTELFGNETNCGSSGAELGAGVRCPTNNVLGVCREPEDGGYRFTIAYNSFPGGETAADSACTVGLGGTWSTGYSTP